MNDHIAQPLSLSEILTPEQLRYLKDLQQKYGKFFFSIDDVLSTTTEDTEMTSEASEFQEKREILKQSIANNLHLYPDNEYDPEVRTKYKNDPLTYWKEKLKDYDIVLQDIKNIHCLHLQLEILKIELEQKKLKAPLSSMQLTPEEKEQDIEKLKEINTAIEESTLYDRHYTLYKAHNLDQDTRNKNILLHYKHYTLYKAHNLDKETIYNNLLSVRNVRDLQVATAATYTAYIKQTDLKDTSYRSAKNYTWYENIYEPYVLGNIIRSAIAERVQELEAEPQAIEQGNEPSTLNNIKLSQAQKAPNSKGNLVE